MFECGDSVLLGDAALPLGRDQADAALGDRRREGGPPDHYAPPARDAQDDAASARSNVATQSFSAMRRFPWAATRPMPRLATDGARAVPRTTAPRQRGMLRTTRRAPTRSTASWATSSTPRIRPPE